MSELLLLRKRLIAKRAAKAERVKKLKEFRNNLKQQRTDDPLQKCTAGAEVCCKESWSKANKETKTISNQTDVVERNKQINAAYADLYLNDKSNPKVQKWAATASLVSKQVGCTMVNNVVASNETLGVGNVAIFDNIYPTLKMYELSQKAQPPMTYDELMKCLDGKIDNENLKKLKKPLKFMFAGKGNDAAIKIAKHEQEEIVQDSMWDSKWMWVQATANMILQGLPADPNVYFVADCSKPSDRELEFPSWKNLAYADTRVEYYKKTFIPYFDKISKNNGEMDTIMQGIRNVGGTH